MPDLPNMTPGADPLLAGPVAELVNHAGGDPLDLVSRIELLERAAIHWYRETAPHAGEIERLLTIVERQAATIEYLSSRLQECYTEKTAQINALTARVDSIDEDLAYAPSAALEEVCERLANLEPLL